MVRQAGAVLAMVFLAHATAAQPIRQGDETAGTADVAAADQGGSVAMSVEGNAAVVGRPLDVSQTVFSDGFEGSFPGSQWHLMYSSAAGTNQTVRWGKSTYRAATGTGRGLSVLPLVALIFCANIGWNHNPAVTKTIAASETITIGLIV